MKIIQITDTHLFRDDESLMYGVKTNEKFEEVMAKIIKEEIHDTSLILLTGDISQDETIESYQKIADCFLNIRIPVYWITGNHDHPRNMSSVFANVRNFHQTTNLSLPHWHLIFLNTRINDRDDGFLHENELTRLKSQVNACTDKKIAIVMHHHPLSVNTPLIDNYILKNNQEFWHIISESKVELVICGHVHGDYSLKHGKISIEASPATCLQWKKGTLKMKIVKKIGYKIYYLNQDGYKTVAKLW